MFRLTSAIGKNTLGLPFKLHPAAAAPSPCINAHCCYSKQRLVRTHDVQRCPDPTPPDKDRTLLYIALSAAAVSLVMGGFAVYAKSNQEFRDWLTVYAPWADDFVAVAYQENMDYAQFVNLYLHNLKKSSKEDSLQVQPCAMGGDGTMPVAPADDGEIKCEASPAITDKDVCEMEECVRRHGSEILRCYKIVIEACQDFAKNVDTAMSSFDLKKIKKLEIERDIRNQKITTALETVDEDVKKLGELSEFLVRIDQKLPSLDKLKEYLQGYLDNIEGSRAEMLYMRHALDAYDIYYNKVIKVLDRYADDNKSLFGVDFYADKPSLKEDPDLFFILTTRLMKALEGDIKYMIPKTSEMASRGIAMLPDDERSEAQKKVDSGFSKAKGEMTKSIDNKLKELQKELDEKQKRVLAQDAAAFKLKADKLIKNKLNTAQEKTEEMIANLLNQERAKLDAELDEMKALVDDAEQRLDDALASERERRRARDLWEAGAGILAAIKQGKPKVKIDPQIKMLEKAGKYDKLVITLLKSIPDNIRRDGVVPESVLRGRYHRMEDVALKVALVEKEGGPLPIYVMSFIQSLLLFIKFQLIPRNEIENPPDQPPDTMDTFDLLQRARYWVERGHVGIAVRYVTALEGASRSVAETWLKAAKDHLQMRQAAEVVMSHATAISLNHI